MQVSGTQSHKAQRMRTPSLAAPSFVASLHWLLCYMIGMHLSSIIYLESEPWNDGSIDQSQLWQLWQLWQVSMGAFWVSQPMALWCCSRLTLWLCRSTWKIRRQVATMCYALKWNRTVPDPENVLNVDVVHDVALVPWWLPILDVLNIWFCWHPATSTVCQGSSFLANETLVTQLHLECYNLFDFGFFSRHVEFVEWKGQTFPEDLGDSGFTVFAGALWATCSRGQGSWFIGTLNLGTVNEEI